MTPSPEFDIVPYVPTMKRIWDDFVDKSRNGTFLLKRDYMDYHSDRFADNSFIFTRNGNVYSLLPACRIENKIYSHVGLTYGGLIMDNKCTVTEILTIFNLLKNHLTRNSIAELIYKPIPHIYHSIPSEEDLYALFRSDATLISRNVSSVIFHEDRIKFRDIRKSGIRKAIKSGIEVRESSDFKSFWKILSDNLMNKYQVFPVHSLEEIILLSQYFPQNIRLFGAFLGHEMIAGVVVYVSRNVAHCQYISTSSIGKECGALDLVFDTLVNHIFANKRYFDFGTSNECGGKVLNESLIYQKEGFGGRAVCYDCYSIKTYGIGHSVPTL